MPRWSAASSSRLELARRAKRMDARPPERLVGVDVPDARERALVEQRRLDRRAAARERARRGARAVNAAPSGSGPRRAVEVGVELARLEQEPGAEPAHVAVGDVRSVV